MASQSGPVTLVGRWPVAGVALAGALFGGVSGIFFDELHTIAASAVLAGCMAAIAIVDLRSFKVPDRWNVAAALAGFFAIWVDARGGLQEPFWAVGRAALDGAICAAALFLVREVYFRLRGFEGLGLGDVKLAATGGIWLGWQLFATAVALAACIALILVLAHGARGKPWPRHRKIPLAAFLAPAIWLCWFGVRLVVPNGSM